MTSPTDPASESNKKENTSILVVDDSKTDRKIIGHILMKEGYKIYQACDGPSALELLKHTKFDLLLVDVNMPGMNGYELIQAASSSVRFFKNTPVIMLSSYSEEAYVVQGIEKGVSDYIVKPFTRSGLVDRVQIILARHRAEDEAEREKDSSFSKLLRGSPSYTEAVCNVLLLIDKSHPMTRFITTVLSVMECNITVVDRHAAPKKNQRKMAFDIALLQVDDPSTSVLEGAERGEDRTAARTLASYGFFHDKKTVEFCLSSTEMDRFRETPAVERDAGGGRKSLLGNLVGGAMHPNRVLRIPSEIEELRKLVVEVAKNKQGRAWLLSHLRQSSTMTGIGRISVVDRNVDGFPLVFVDGAFLRFMGWTESDILGKPMSVFEGKDTDPQTSQQISSAIEKGTELSVVVLYYKKDGTPFWNYLHLKPIKDNSQGLIFRMAGVHRIVDADGDISDDSSTGGDVQRYEDEGREDGGTPSEVSSLGSPSPSGGSSPVALSDAGDRGDRESLIEPSLLAQKEKMVAELQYQNHSLAKELEMQKAQCQSLMNNIISINQEKALLLQRNQQLHEEAARRGYIPQFYFPNANSLHAPTTLAPGDGEDKAKGLPLDIRRLFSISSGENIPSLRRISSIEVSGEGDPQVRLPLSSRGKEAFDKCMREHFQFPAYFEQLVITRLRDGRDNVIRLSSVQKYWDEEIQGRTMEQRCWDLLRTGIGASKREKEKGDRGGEKAVERGGRRRVKKNYIAPEDLDGILNGLVASHPDLRVIRRDPRLADMYKTVTVTSIFFSFNLKRNQRLSWEEFRQSGLTEIFFSAPLSSIESLYPIGVVQNKYLIDAFTELDWEQQGYIGSEAIRSLDRRLFSEYILKRIFDGYPRPLARKGMMSFEDFVWFTLALNDRMGELSAGYWLRCLDEDGDGYLSVHDLRAYWEAKAQENAISAQNPTQFEDFECFTRQIFDVVRPEEEGRISARDITRHRAGGIVFDLAISLQTNMHSLGLI